MNKHQFQADRALILFIALILALALAFYSYNTNAQEHEHGVSNLPDWYDIDCCNLNDCRPVEDKDVDFTVNELNQPIAMYKDLKYERPRWRRSKDERYHACFRGLPVYCIYIPTGA